LKFLSLTLLLILLSTNLFYAQVGIGTVDPSAQLEILGTDTGIPALQLNPQSAPLGDTMGQLAVIGELLYMYDATRGKWLSVESTTLQFGYGTSALFPGDDQVLFFGGDVELGGPIMPYNGTIVYMTINSSGGNATKRMDIQINGTDIGNNTDSTMDGRIRLSSGSFNYNEYNIDFDAGDYLTIKAANNGDAVDDPVAIIWIKWRQ